MIEFAELMNSENSVNSVNLANSANLKKILNSGTKNTVLADNFQAKREKMIERLRDEQGISDVKVLEAMRFVPRHLFVPSALQSNAYGDHALPINANQTISQPFIVARMTELLAIDNRSRVLEIGAGSGYQTAILAQLAKEIFALERVPELAEEAGKRLKELKINGVTLKCDDGTKGWKFYAPFDVILVAAGSPEVPKPLLEQLKIGGKLVIPVGKTLETQRLLRVTRDEKGFLQEDFGACAFVPLIGEYGWRK